MVRYIWQSPSWPSFRWDSPALLLPLGRARQAQGEILAKIPYFEPKTEAEVLVEEAFTTATIEGDALRRDSIRSSVAHRLGLPTAGLPAAERRVEGLVEMLLDAARNHDSPLDAERLKRWHAALFPSGFSGLRKITVAAFRSGEEPMQVVSGPIGKERVHFQAPPSRALPAEIDRFLEWFSSPPPDLDGLLCAAIAHFWFVTIHPFPDGNGRIARAISEMALARDERTGTRLYSLSAQIMAERSAYYETLEKTQKGDGDITPWLAWFLECIERAVRKSEQEIQKSMSRARVWQGLAAVNLNDRQRKVVARLVEAGPGGFQGGVTNRKYRGVTGATRETAKRDISDLVAKGVLAKNPAGGRSSSYELVWPE
jgi:Fic family protein